MTQQEKDFRIFDFIIRTAWLHFEDALSIGKIKLFAGTYRKGEGKAKTTAFHYLDVRALRPHLADMSWGKPVKFVEFKGSPGKGDVPPESRILQVNSDPEGNVWWNLAHGPGKMMPTGAIKPNYSKRQHTKLIKVKMTRDEARAMACQVTEYLQAYTTMQMLQRVQPQHRSSVSIEEANAEWFEAPKVHQTQSVPVTAVNGNGHSNGATATAVRPKQKKVNPMALHKRKVYANEYPVHPDRLGDYESYWHLFRKVPYTERALIDWIYK